MTENTIGSVAIRDFRGVRELKLDGLGRVNIITGRNNSCKSALLEALALAATYPAFKDALGAPVPRSVIASRGRPYSAKALVRAGAGNASVSVDTPEGGISLELYPTKPGEYATMLTLFERRLKKAVEDRAYAVADGYRGLSAFVVAATPGRIFTVLPSGGGAGALYLHPRLAAATLITKVVDELVKRAELERALSAYADAVGKSLRVADVRFSRSGVLLVRVEGGGYLPYSALGDGLRTSLYYVLTLSLLKKGVVFIDSPEAYAHPGLVDVLAHAVAASPHQYFIVTQSLELIAGVLAARGGVKVVRMSDCEVVDVLDGDEVRFKLEEVGQDIREV